MPTHFFQQVECAKYAPPLNIVYSSLYQCHNWRNLISLEQVGLLLQVRDDPHLLPVRGEVLVVLELGDLLAPEVVLHHIQQVVVVVVQVVLGVRLVRHHRTGRLKQNRGCNSDIVILILWWSILMSKLRSSNVLVRGSPGRRCAPRHGWLCRSPRPGFPRDGWLAPAQWRALRQ